jgi:hypothetical protein
LKRVRINRFYINVFPNCVQVLTKLRATLHTEAAAVISCSGATFTAKKYSMTTVPNAVCPASLPQSADAIPLYTASPWIQKNTLADIAYLADLSGTLAGTSQVKAATELDKTVPANVTSNVPLAMAYCPQNSGKMLWKSLEGTKHDLCQPIGLVAFADF